MISSLSTMQDPKGFDEVVSCQNFVNWLDGTEDELKIIQKSEVWKLVDISNSFKSIGCNQLFKINRYS